MAWQIEVITLYRFRVPGPEVLLQRGFSETIEMAIHAFLLRGHARVVLVDTGLPPDVSGLNAAIRARKGPEAGFHACGPGLVAELAAREATPELVLVTSFGPYAVGGLGQMPPLPLAASARGLADLAQPEEPALLHPLPATAVARLQAARPIDGEAELFPGLRFLEVGIHHPASAAVLVEVEGGTVAISDPVFTTRNLVEGLALGAAEFAGGWHRMVRMLGTRAHAILPIHDPKPVPVPRESWHALLRTP